MASTLTAEAPRNNRRAGSEARSERPRSAAPVTEAANEESGAAAPPTNPRDAEINDAWVQAIQGGRQAQGDSAAEGETRFANPGEASSANEEQDAGADGRSNAESLFPREEGPSFFSVALRFFGLLAVMGGLFYLVMRYIRNKSGLPSVGGGELVQVLVSAPLVQGKFLQVVDVAGKLYVLGVSDSGVQMISEINDGIAADRIRLWQSSRRPVERAQTAMDRLVAAFKGVDVRFWQGSEQKRDFPDFQQLLRAQGGAAPSLTPVAGGVAESAPTDESSGDDLKELLRQQKARLTALNRPPRT